MTIHWVTQRFANGVVNAWHSYLPPTRGGLFALGAFDAAEGEAGTSYKAAGWKVVARTEPRPWAKSGHHPTWKGRETSQVASRADVLVGQPKLRWEVAL